MRSGRSPADQIVLALPVATSIFLTFSRPTLRGSSLPRRSRSGRRSSPSPKRSALRPLTRSGEALPIRLSGARSELGPALTPHKLTGDHLHNRLVTVLADNVAATSALQDRRLRSELQMTYSRLIEAVATVAGRRYEPVASSGAPALASATASGSKESLSQPTYANVRRGSTQEGIARLEKLTRMIDVTPDRRLLHRQSRS